MLGKWTHAEAMSKGVLVWLFAATLCEALLIIDVDDAA